jgi:enoyl-CoA hydratase/carnithine racemase
MMDALFEHEGPMVACVNGHAIAGGCVIALCADLRVAAADPRIRIGLNEVALGLEFPPKIMKLARHRLSRHQVERALLEAGLYDPETAVRLGFVDEVSPDPVARARALLDAIAAHPRPIYAATKRTLRAGALTLGDADRRYFRGEVLPKWTAPAVKEKVLAALKR